MKLVVIITGLVLLAPDRDRIHLFFPEMDMDHPKAELHTPSFNYTTTGGFKSVSLEGWTLNLGTVAEPGGAATLPAEIVDLGKRFTRGVPRDWVDDLPSRRVHGRVSLPWPDAFEVEEDAEWIMVRGLRSKRLNLTNKVVLRYDRPIAPPPNWELHSFPWGPGGPGGKMNIPAFRPSGSTDTMRIFHIPPDGGRGLKRWEEAVHFQGYVDLLRLRTIDHLQPRPRVYLNEDKGLFGALSPFNCMLASASVT